MGINHCMSAESRVRCCIDDVMKLEVEIKDSKSLLQFLCNDKGIFIYQLKNFDLELHIAPISGHIGKILKRACKNYLEFGVSYIRKALDVDTCGGYYFRIYADGTIVEPSIRWPEHDTYVCIYCGKKAYHTVDDFYTIGSPRCSDENCCGNREDMEIFDDAASPLPSNYHASVANDS